MHSGRHAVWVSLSSVYEQNTYLVCFGAPPLSRRSLSHHALYNSTQDMIRLLQFQRSKRKILGMQDPACMQPLCTLTWCGISRGLSLTNRKQPLQISAELDRPVNLASHEAVMMSRQTPFHARHPHSLSRPLSTPPLSTPDLSKGPRMHKVHGMFSTLLTPYPPLTALTLSPTPPLSHSHPPFLTQGPWRHRRH